MSMGATGRQTSTTPTASPKHGRRTASSGECPTVAALPCGGSAVVMTQHRRSDIILSTAHHTHHTMLRPNAHRTTGQLSAGDGGLKGTCPVNGGAGSGRAFTITPRRGLGRQWVGDKDANAKRAAAQYRKDRRQAARDRAAGMWETQRLASNY